MKYQPGHILLEKYRIEEFIGSGAFAEVYRVTHLELNAPRAIKVLNRDQPGLGDSHYQEYQQRFRLEAQLGARINHPNVVRIYDFEKDNNTLILVMEYAAGGSLRDRLKEKARRDEAIAIKDALRICHDIAAGLSSLHDIDIVHRDIKPSNILFDQNGNAKITDLGLVQVPGVSKRSLDSKAALHPGTPGYKSPEQEHTSTYLKSPSDIYSLGAILYEMLTGRLYASQKPGQTVGAIEDRIPKQVDALCSKMLATNPSDRFWDGAEAAKAIQAMLKAPQKDQDKQDDKGVKSSSPGIKRFSWLFVGAGVLSFLVVIGVVLGLAFGGVFGGGPDGGASPVSSPMLGEFNIVVAEFQLEANDLDPETGLAVAQQVYQRIDTRLQEASQDVDVVYDVRGPEQAGTIVGDTTDQRAEAAAELADMISADIVVYGTINDDGVNHMIVPEMYISERLFAVIPEFLGRHPLGNAVLIPSGSGDFASRVEANRDIAGRAQAIAYIATGVSLFNLKEYESAISFFELALQAGGWEGQTGKESLYLMLGNAAGKLETLDQAEEYFQRALEVNPDYARAYVGLGETYFLRAMGVPPVDTFAEISQPDLDLAEKQYQAALSAADQPPTADIPTKVDFGLGRLSLVQYQISGEQSLLTAARASFQAVVEAGEKGNDRIAELVAQAHGHLGSIALLSSDLETAQREYQIAAESTQTPRAKAAFWAQLGSVYDQVGNRDLAIEAYQKAVSIAIDEDSRQNYQQSLDQIQNR